MTVFRCRVTLHPLKYRCRESTADLFSGVLFRGIFDCFETGKIDRMFGEIFDSMSACADFYRICAGAVF